MKSKFMKDEVLQEKESARQDCSIDPALAKEYVRALTEEQIPQPLLDKMADLINESIPELVRQSIDKEAEKRNIYNHLLSPFTDYIRFIYEKIQTEGSSQWKQDEIRLKEQVKELNDYIHELSSKQEEFQSQYLSAERQKRALGERVHELEMRIVTFEADKEQSDMEKSALNNKLKVAAVQEKNKADELAALQEENNIARYTALQNQLNPHFLFNSLNTLISEIRYNPKNAELFTQHLSDVYRYTLQCQNQRLVTLQDELGFLDSYIFLHQVRLGDCIYVHNNVPDEWKEMKMPPLTLQLLVENVIKHNVIHSGKPMVIELCNVEEPPTLIICNPIRPKKCGVVSGMGLKNLSARYKLLCNQDIVIENESDKFTVKIPLLS